MLHGHHDARRLKTSERERESSPDGEVVRWAHDSVATLLPHCMPDMLWRSNRQMQRDQCEAQAQSPIKALQPTTNPLRGLSAAELGR